MDTLLSNYLLPFLLWVLILPLIYSQPSQELDCTRFEEQERVCMNIRQCKPLLDQVREFGGFAGDRLRSAICGWDNKDPLVCCPIQPATETLVMQQTPYGPLRFPNCGQIDHGISFPRTPMGFPAPLGLYPWMAALGYKSSPDSQIEWECGGSLISARHVLTAAHCVQGLNLSVVRLGDLDLDDSVDDGATPVDLGIEKATVHPEFNRSSHTNDVAVLKLTRDVVFTNLTRPICLPVYNTLRTEEFSDNTFIPYGVGWGANHYRGASISHLHYGLVPVLSRQQCQETHYPQPVVIDDRIFCIHDTHHGRNACKGDSGTPIILPFRESDHTHAFYAIGIVSHSFRCAESVYPKICTKVSKYLDFIIEHLN